ncbi:BON domain-containing protein [Trinickia acidisoli]|uniref:BON domain-containing protein n=1 Tax=Trinickia acidisoli TaxID=2767482 RepID=UPI001A8C81CA|nr:BON domain-containing protein [Trinickia acidisoli]
MRANRVMKTLVRGTLAAATAAALVASLQGCVLAVAGAAGGGALMATDRRTLGTQTADREIQVKAYSQIADQLGNTAHVDVTVFNRRVLLTGEVPTDAMKQQAEQTARGVGDVEAIVNELKVAPATEFSGRANDSYLVARVKTALIAEKGLSANDFKVVAERGNIYLMGLVTQDEGMRGASVAASVPGVMRVVKVFQYIQPEQAQAMAPTASQAASAPSSAQQPAEAAPTVGAVPMGGGVTEQPLDTQAPAPVSNSTQVHPGSSGQVQ